jgi:hypothetical protein
MIRMDSKGDGHDIFRMYLDIQTNITGEKQFHLLNDSFTKSKEMKTP